MNREIIFYETAAGKCPVEEFLNSLAGQQTAEARKKDYFRRKTE
jgi:hypothetical protein